MNPIAYVALFALLFVPTATAESTLTKQTDDLVHEGGTIEVLVTLEFRVDDPGQYVPTARFHTPQDATPSAASFTPGAGTPLSLQPAEIEKRTETDVVYDTYVVNLTRLQPSAANGQAYSVTLRYTHAGDRVDLRTTYAAPQLVVFATPDAGEAASTSSWAGGFVALGDGRYHAGRSNAPADWAYSVAFVAAPESPGAAGPEDLTSYAWGMGGLILGAFLVYGAFRRGWIGSGRSQKYVKGGGMESRALLEARRRTLLAALKDLEQAHETKEVPDDAYAPLKEEYKAQAVRVMRNLEEKREP